MKKEELSQENNSFKYFLKLAVIALFFVGVGIAFITYIFRFLFSI